jgi:hypothetical protein
MTYDVVGVLHCRSCMTYDVVRHIGIIRCRRSNLRYRRLARVQMMGNKGKTKLFDLYTWPLDARIDSLLKALTPPTLGRQTHALSKRRLRWSEASRRQHCMCSSLCDCDAPLAYKWAAPFTSCGWVGQSCQCRADGKARGNACSSRRDSVVPLAAHMWAARRTPQPASCAKRGSDS